MLLRVVGELERGSTASRRAASAARALAAERLIGQLLIAVTYVSVGLLPIGVVLMIADADLADLGRAAARPADPRRRSWSRSSRRPSCGSGMLAVVAAPIGRVIVAAVAYARESDWLMLGVSRSRSSLVIAIGVLSALALTA